MLFAISKNETTFVPSLRFKRTFFLFDVSSVNRGGIYHFSILSVHYSARMSEPVVQGPIVQGPKFWQFTLSQPGGQIMPCTFLLTPPFKPPDPMEILLILLQCSVQKSKD